MRKIGSVLHDILGVKPIMLRFIRGGFTLVFFVIPQPKHQRIVEARVKEMLAGLWGNHFEQVCP